MIDSIIKKIENRSFAVGVVGLGYVGLPLVNAFYQKGFRVIGLDIDREKIRKFDEGKSYIKHFSDDIMTEMRDSGLVEFTTDFAKADQPDALITCVPTPLNKYREPDMSYVEGTTKMLAPHVRKGQLIVLESTTYPGTSVELIKPILEMESGLVADKDFFLAYSPEREDPGNPDFSTATIPKVLGADGEDAKKIAEALYSEVIVKVVPVRDTKTAEAVKLLENIYRSVNIALVNELKVVFQKMDIDIYEVIEAAKTKPFGYTAFYPGPGLGGHCIPIDPFYLTWKAREFGMSTRFIELAGEINTAMPQFVIDRTIWALNEREKSLKGSKILCVGLAYKPNVDDMRESPTFAVMDLLKQRGAQVSYYDPYIPTVPKSREHEEWTGTKSMEWSKTALSGFDAVVICTNHTDVDYSLLNDSLVIDTRHVLEDGPNVVRA